MADAVQRSIVVNTAPEKLYAVIVDYERYPEFLDNIKMAKVVKRDGHRVEVDFEVSLIGKRIPYTLAFEEEPVKGIRWTLVKSSFMKENNGAWTLRKDGDAKTHATYALSVKVSSFIPRALSTSIAGSELPKVLEAFKKRTEAA
jgi:ribosome-associated toxin RatA of RatAB toxin-antitoxin module